MFNGKTRLYDLDADIGERVDLADQHPDVVAKLERIMDEAHTAHPNWQLPSQKKN